MRLCAGRYHEASTRRNRAVPSCFSTQSAETTKRLLSVLTMFLPISGNSFRRAETNAEPPVLLALLFYLGNVNIAYFLRFGNMGAAAGLAVDAGIFADADEADPAKAHRRAHILGFDDARIGLKFLIGDPLQEDRMVGFHQRHQLCRHLILVDGFRHVEIDTRFVFTDRRAGDRPLADNGEQVAGRVHAHQLVAARPVHMQGQLLADFRKRLAFERHMDDDALVGAVFGDAEFDTRPISPLEKAAIAGLAAGRRIKAGLVEFYAAILMHRRDDRFYGGKIKIVTEQGIHRHFGMSSNGFVRNRNLAFRRQPLRNRQPLGAQEIRIEQLRLITITVVA
ncbi:hypothetical protein AGR3A_Cc260256 [Agrobacterium tomkonis CFBP 6623]|uniref:Uncharacterized protein n=1 Tax=Agrobacterium tomkonis CFBP 6623 TaxID=1183432 RepID=A0A1S7PLX6_9HYPH|nr:hypothetical protein AGR3A_Cc260256 [Agrobacterium tomkonis CFBP 6623]